MEDVGNWRFAEREAALRHLAQRILAVRLDHPLRVCKEGVDAAGKTRLADDLARVMGAPGGR